MRTAIWNQAPISSTATNRQQQFDEITNVSFTLREEPVVKRVENPNATAVFHVFDGGGPKLSLQEALQKNIVEVKFMTLSKAMREMVCTLRSDLVPKSSKSKPSNSKTAVLGGQGNLLKVFALDRGEWRSIRPDSVLSWKIKSTL